MKNRIKYFAIIALTISYLTTLADSPLTSTWFCEAYKSEKIVEIASNSNGILTTELMNYLIVKKNPIAVKMAIINQLSWDINGKDNATIFYNFLVSKQGYKSKDDFFKKGSDFELLCMAYLKSLDNYFDVTEAVNIAEKALDKNPKSYTFNIITALIKAQQAFDTDWCKVYSLTNDVRLNESLFKDMDEEAIKIIFEYMDLYKC